MMDRTTKSAFAVKLSNWLGTIVFGVLNIWKTWWTCSKKLAHHFCCHISLSLFMGLPTLPPWFFYCSLLSLPAHFHYLDITVWKSNHWILIKKCLISTAAVFVSFNSLSVENSGLTNLKSFVAVFHLFSVLFSRTTTVSWRIISY